MLQAEILEGNNLCAEFLGYVNTTPTDKDFNIYKKQNGEVGNLIETMSMQFHSDWNWLMKVVSKCYSLDMNNTIKYFEYGSFLDADIEVIFGATVKFIKAYNEGSKTISLDEYFSRRSELDMEVLLKTNEYRLGDKVGRITQLFINAFPTIEYVIQDGDNIVWVADEHGNPKKKSIFRYQS